MISTLKKIQAKKTSRDGDGGFTLIELLIVIVVLGILAAVVVFSLGSVTKKSAVAACQADGATVNTAMAAYQANLGIPATAQSDLTGTAASGGPYLQSWPDNTTHYLFGISSGGLYEANAGVTTTVGGAGWNPWVGASTCSVTGAVS